MPRPSENRLIAILLLMLMLTLVVVTACGSGLKIGSSPPEDSVPPDPLDPYQPVIPPDTKPAPVLNISRTLSVQFGISAPYNQHTSNYTASFFISSPIPSTTSNDTMNRGNSLGHYTYAKGINSQGVVLADIQESTFATAIYNAPTPGFGISDANASDANASAIDSIYIDDMVRDGDYYLATARYRNGEGEPNEQLLLLLSGNSPEVYHITPWDIYNVMEQENMSKFQLRHGNTTDAQGYMPPLMKVHDGKLFYGLYSSVGTDDVRFMLFTIPLPFTLSADDDPASNQFTMRDTDLVLSFNVTPSASRFDPKNILDVESLYGSDIVYIPTTDGIEERSIASNFSYGITMSRTSYRAIFEHASEHFTVADARFLYPHEINLPAYILSNTGDLHYMLYDKDKRSLDASLTARGVGKHWYQHILVNETILLLYLADKQKTNSLRVRRIYNISTGEFANPRTAQWEQTMAANFVYTLVADAQTLANKEFALLRRGNAVFLLNASIAEDTTNNSTPLADTIQVNITDHTTFNPNNGGQLYVLSNNGKENYYYNLSANRSSFNNRQPIHNTNIEAGCTMDNTFPKEVFARGMVGYHCPNGTKYYFYNTKGFQEATPKEDAMYILINTPMQGATLEPYASLH